VIAVNHRASVAITDDEDEDGGDDDDDDDEEEEDAKDGRNLEDEGDMLILTDDEVLARGLELVGFNDARQARSKQESNDEVFKEHYGSMPFVYAQLWEDLQLIDEATARVDNAKQKDFDYFMGALYFLKVYPTEKDSVLANSTVPSDADVIGVGLTSRRSAH
jgi:hypothetical protein